MKVTCIGNTGRHLPNNYLVSGNSINTEFQVELGSTYIVYGICLWDDNTLHYLLLGEPEDPPSWYPAELFHVSDNLLPMEWYFSFHSVRENRVITAIWGYKELALDLQHYDELIEREKHAIKVFLARKKEIDEFM